MSHHRRTNGFAVQPGVIANCSPRLFDSLEQFRETIQHEFCAGSAIDPILFKAAVRFHADLELDETGEPITPIHDALGWNYTRFGQQVKETLYAAFLTNEDGTPWQAKLSNARIDRKKTSTRLKNTLRRSHIPDWEFWQLVKAHPECVERQKYETPVGNGARAFLPPVPLAIWKRIAARYNLPLGDPWRWATAHSDDKSALLAVIVSHADLESWISELADTTIVPQFWDYIAAHPQIPIVPTEGGKKGLALLSQGFVPLALYGVNGGYSGSSETSRQLTPDVARFATGDRPVILAFDQDEKVSTRIRVSVALFRFSQLLEEAGCAVQISTWNGRSGKGVDDLIVAAGAVAWENAYYSALSLQHWILRERLEHRLTYRAQIHTVRRDLSTLNPTIVPLTGIIGIDSGKGTGKTKFISRLVEGQSAVLAAGHRIALMRNLCPRLGLDYRGDLDKVRGEFISGSGYALRIGFCVDALLAINPEKFSGCDLIIDEAVQVLRHLLTSTTCARDGKRPAMLARLRELVRVARRVIVADADLNNAVLNYLRDLRQCDDSPIEPVFLIRNDYKLEGYPVRFLVAPDRTAVTNELIKSTKRLLPGKVLFIATDSKGLSKSLFRTLHKLYPDKRILTINSDSSGGICEREFMESPDAVLQRHEYDIVICSPSVATGVSIECQGIVDQVYGIFTGGSSTDADIAQSLIRVREPVQRTVWCAERGSNFSPVSRSTSLKEFKELLMKKTTATVRLIRSSLREDIASAIDGFNWESDPHLHLYAQISVEQNRSMHNLRDALLVRLQQEGQQVQVEERESIDAVKAILKEARQAEREIHAESLAVAADLTYSEVVALEQKESPSPEERRAVEKHYFKEFYCLESVTVEDVIEDNEGRMRRSILSLEELLYPNLAIDRTVRSIDRQTQWNQGYCFWDTSTEALKRRLRQELGLDRFVEWAQQGWEWTKYDIADYAAQARMLAPQIKAILNFKISSKTGDVQIVHELLRQLAWIIHERLRQIQERELELQ